MQTKGGNQPIEFAFRTVTSRMPTPAEVTFLREARSEYLAEFQTDESSAAKLLSVGESALPKNANKPALAADTLVCNIILNLDEALTR